MYCHTYQDFVSMFDPKTGFYLRSGILRDGKDTGVDPFMAEFPELLDVGIMGHCSHGLSGLCVKAGIQCYQSGLEAASSNMSLEDFQKLAEQCHGKVYQFALGGRGDPDQHEQFEDMLRTCKEHGIVPNFTTSGLGLNAEKARLCKTYCGAVAVSWYRSPYTLQAIDLLVQEGVTTNIHYVLSNSTLQEAIDHLKTNDFPTGVHAVVFLLHKPVGQGSFEEVIANDNPLLPEFLELVAQKDHPFKIGFDACSIPMLLQAGDWLDPASLDTCEGGRFSAYVTPDFKLLPCSFDNDKQRWAVDLHTHTVQEAWNSDAFEAFRNHFRMSCPSCSQKKACLGGCPICPDIVLCPHTEHRTRMGC